MSEWGRALLLAAVALLAGVMIGSTHAESKERPSAISPIRVAHIWVDAETGCEYLRHNDFSPRYGRDGKQICREMKP